MRYIIIALFICYSLSGFSQRGEKEWFLSAGLNAINSQGTKSPLNGIGDWANGLPFSVAGELMWESGLAVEQSITFNKFAEGDEIDGQLLTEDYTYTSFDSHVKYYFGNKIFPNSTWVDFYANAGVGFFSIENTNVSFNIGGGILFWLNRRETIGIRAQVIGKMALDHAQSGLDNNHFQTHIQAFIAL